MCGIFAYFGRANATKTVFTGLIDLEYRGYDSWGIVALVHKSLVIKKDLGKLANVKLSLPPSHLALGHTRWATHGGVTVANSHPHLDCTSRLALVHNGIVENYIPLKKDLVKRGHLFSSETDSEVVVHLIEEQLKSHSFLDAVRLTFRQLNGLNTIAVLDRITGTIVAYRAGSPLVSGRDESGGIYLSSDLPSLTRRAQDIVILEDGEGVSLSRQGIHLVTINDSLSHPPQFVRLNYHNSEVGLGSHPHYLIKEISEQPAVLTTIATCPHSLYHKLSTELKHSPQLTLTACGTALFACEIGCYYFARNFRYIPHVFDASEASNFLSIQRTGILLAISQSGETMDTLEATKLAKSQGLKTGALVNVVGSSLSRLVNNFVPLQAGHEQAVLSTKAFLAMLATLYLLSQPNAKSLATAQRLLSNTASEITRLLHSRSQLRKLAKSLLKAEHLYVIGRGINYPIALEGALKLKESSYIHAEGMAAGMLKHGTIALIEPGTPVIALVPNDETKADMLSSVMEVKARGARVIGLSPHSHSSFDTWIKVEDLGDLSPLVNIVPLQLLAYELTVLKGYDPDKPRNLAKSVTVK